VSERRAAQDAQKKEHGVLYYLGLGLSWGLLAFVVLIAALVILVPAVTRSTPYTILTSSMEPGYPPGTLVIVTYQLESGKPEVVTHRVTQIIQPNLPDGEKSFVTKGDANSEPDAEPVKPVQIRGAVWYAVPWIGWVNNLVNGDMRAVIIPLIAGLLFLYGGWLIVSNRLEKRRDRRAALAAERDASGPADDVTA